MNWNMSFLPEATDFTDMAVKPRPELEFSDMTGYTELCPKCKGYGGWNLQVNAYPSHPSHPHFQAMCRQCWGWGWVKPNDATCVHEFVEIKPDEPWRCWHTIQCSKCGRIRSYDSSD